MTAPEAMIELAAALLVDAHGRLVLVRKRGTAIFMQPGGKIEPGELPINALIREINEEIGLRLTDEEALLMGVFTSVAANEPGRMIRVHLFRVALSTDATPPTARAEIAEIALLTAGATPTYQMAPFTCDQVLPLWLQHDGQGAVDQTCTNNSIIP